MNVVDLFCGVGGLSQGFCKAGFSIVAAYDNWQAAIDTYRRNLSHTAECLDLRQVSEVLDKIKPLKADMIVGGPPCQDFSSAGKRREGGNAHLTEIFAKIVAACQPKIVVMENVPRTRNSQAYQYAKALMSDAGFSFFETVLDASRCGVPQRRQRFFAIGWRSRRRQIGVKLETYFQDALSSERLTVADYMGLELPVEHYYRHPRNYSRRAIFSVHEPSPTIRGVNRPVPPSYKGHRLDTAPADRVRPLTSYERSRIQTFSPFWTWTNEYVKYPQTTVELLIGNAVPVNLASFVAAGIREVGLCTK